jgi:protein-disulfide isomerase
MSNIVTHSHGNKKGSNSLVVVVVSFLVIVVLLFGLNFILSKQNKNNTDVITKVDDARYTLGNADAKIKLVEYADFQCPACSIFSKVFPEVYNYINGKYGSSTLSLTYKYFPLVSIHQNALLSAYSVEAAKDQGKFWEMHDLVFEKQSDWSEALDAKSKLEDYAKSLGLDMTKFVADRDSDVTHQTVDKALVEATKLQLDHTPTVYMNGVEITNLSLTAKDIEKLIEDNLNGVVATSTNK